MPRIMAENNTSTLRENGFMFYQCYFSPPQCFDGAAAG
jgi:hypothetical protein